MKPFDRKTASPQNYHHSIVFGEMLYTPFFRGSQTNL